MEDLFAWVLSPKQKAAAYNRQYRIKNAERLAIYQQSWSEENREVRNANQRAYHETLIGRANLLLHAAKKRALLKQHEFRLTHADVLAGLTKGTCERTGMSFVFVTGIRLNEGRGTHPLSPSIDKIDPFGIYEPSNVQYVCTWYNMAKAQLTDEQVLAFCKTLVTYNA